MEAVCRNTNADSVLRKQFSGDFDFRKTETDFSKKGFLGLVSAPQEGSGEECGADSFWIFGRAMDKKVKK